MNYLFIFILFLGSFIFCTGSSRRISCFLNPGLDNNSDLHPNVVHITSIGDKDTIHYIWSTYKLPSVIVVRTSLNTDVLINTTKLISFEKDAILFKNGSPMEAVGLTFDKLWQLNYTKDTSEISDTNNVEDLEMESLLWSDVNETLKCSKSFASAVLKAQNSEFIFSKNGSFEIQFSVSADQELSNEYPHLVFTGNSTLLKLVFDNFHSNFSRVRYGVGLSIFSSTLSNCSKDWDIIPTQSINDEFSPGVFSYLELLSQCSKGDESSFIAWRPVAYIGQTPNVANSSDVTMMEKPSYVPEFSILSVAELLFSEMSNMSAFNLTFGTPGDGFYHTTQYTTWSLLLGTGQMIEIPLSASVIIFASVGLGLVLLFMIAGFGFIIFERCKVKDELLLN